MNQHFIRMLVGLWVVEHVVVGIVVVVELPADASLFGAEHLLIVDVEVILAVVVAEETNVVDVVWDV